MFLNWNRPRARKRARARDGHGLGHVYGGSAQSDSECRKDDLRRSDIVELEGGWRTRGSASSPTIDPKSNPADLVGKKFASERANMRSALETR